MGVIKVKNKEGFFPILMLVIGIILIIISLINLFRIKDFNSDYVIISLSIASIALGLFFVWIGYALRKYGRLSIPSNW